MQEDEVLLRKSGDVDSLKTLDKSVKAGRL